MKTKLATIEHSSDGVFTTLFDEINALRQGTTTPTRANSVCKLCQSVTDHARMLLQAKRYTNGKAEVPMLGKQLRFGK